MEILKIAEQFKNGLEIKDNSSTIEQNKPGTQFSSILDKSMNEVNQLLADADKKGVEHAIGKSENLHDAMIAFEKAETAFKLLVQVRNRAIDAYHEIMRMQV
jgi:flagellar hook-basal body complex protein FliE